MMHAGFIDIPSCWVCGSRTFAREHDAILDLDVYRDQHPELAEYSGEAVWFRRCSRCGFTQPERLPALPGFFDLLYDQLWSPEWVQQEFESDYKDFIFRTILNGLSKRTVVGRRLLDIGAHAGRFMHLARSAGWQPEGIELNPRTAAFAARRTGLPVHAVNVDRLPLSEGRYGAITLIDVLEHVPEPLTLLSRVDDALEAGGWLAVKVPSGPAQRLKERVRARVHRGYRPRLADNLVHVNHFSPSALQAALERVGLRSITVDIAPPELPSAGGYRGVVSNLFRRSLYHGGRLVPRGVDTPLALNLLAFGQKPA
ncbi:MAG TPA: class I SAM-dependent methyltransferase [Vicinamibacterales bacterium]|jgi:SAM-dependent methyltransferase|nr:class I SAM-dependent methyltransferase [Vicinamibacterales bacterium]